MDDPFADAPQAESLTAPYSRKALDSGKYDVGTIGGSNVNPFANAPSGGKATSTGGESNPFAAAPSTSQPSQGMGMPALNSGNPGANVKGMGFPSLGMVNSELPGTPEQGVGPQAFFGGMAKKVLDAGQSAPSVNPATGQVEGQSDEGPAAQLGQYLGSRSPEAAANVLGKATSAAEDATKQIASFLLTQPGKALGQPESATASGENAANDLAGYLFEGGNIGEVGRVPEVVRQAERGGLVGEAPRSYMPAIQEAAQRYGVEPGLLARQLQQESGFRSGAVSPAGARGISQFMPGTAEKYGVDVNDPISSINGQAHYMSDLKKMFGGNDGLALAGYNWGEGHVQAWLRNGADPARMPAETRNYVKSITGQPIEDWLQGRGRAPEMVRERGDIRAPRGLPAGADVADLPMPREPNAAWYKEQDDKLFQLRQQAQADRIQFNQLVESMPDEFKTPEMQERFYKYMEGDPNTELSPSEQAYYRSTIEPLKREERDLYEELKKTDLDVQDYDPTYAHRIVRGRAPVFDALAGERGATANPISGYKSLTAPSVKARKFFVLTDAQGNRKLVTLDNGQLTEINNRIGTPVKTEVGLGEDPTKNIGDKVNIGGKEWTLANARTDEIEANTDTQYYKNAAANTIDNLLRLRAAARAAFHFNDLKNSPEFATIAKKWDAKNIPPNWISPHMPLLSGYKMNPLMAHTIDDFYGRPKTDLHEAIAKVNQLAVRSLFWSPVAHLANTVAFWASARSWDWVTPPGIHSLFVDSAKALVQVVTLGKDYQDMLREGSSFIYAGVKNQDFYAQMMKRLGDDVKRNPSYWDGIARTMTLGASDLVKMLYNGSSKVLWAGSDVFMMQRVMELKRKGLSTKEAINEAEKWIPNYRIPPQVLGSRAVAQVLKDPVLTEFSRYHYGAMKQIANLARDLAGPPKINRLEGTKIPPIPKGSYRVFHGHNDEAPQANPSSRRWVASTPEYAKNYGGGGRNVSYVDLAHNELPDSIREGVELNPGANPTNFQLTPAQTSRLRPYKDTPGQTNIDFGMKDRINAMGNIFVTGAMLYYAWPAISYGIQQLTGDKDLAFGPKGSTKIPSDLLALYNGDKNFVSVVSGIVTMAPVIKTGGELYTGLDWFTGDKINGPVDQVKGIPHQLGREADFAANQMVQPYAMLEQAGRPKTSLAKEALKTGLGLRKKPKKYTPSKYDWRKDARRKKGLIEQGFDKL